MKIIKLDAIASTNTFLKELLQDSTVENFTVVVAKKQVLGRGQMQTKWVSEDGKNLTFSVYCSFEELPITQQKNLNFAVSVSVFEAVSKFELPNLAIKWPNDIMSDKYKICGILIENMLLRQYIKSSIIGIGLNVNQINFPKEIPNASSIKKITQKDVSLDDLLQSFLKRLKENIALLNAKKYDELEEKYLNVLYKKNVPSMFKNAQNVLFMGKILGISQSGKLQIELEDETIKEFGLKEVSFASL